MICLDTLQEEEEELSVFLNDMQGSAAFVEDNEDMQRDAMEAELTNEG